MNVIISFFLKLPIFFIKGAFHMFYRRNRVRVPLDCGTQTITKQSHKDECDIHNILKQFQRTGILDHVSRNSGRFEDLPSDVDYQTSLNSVMAAQDAFNALPAKVRAHFGNDPVAFLAAFNDPDQAEQLREFGLLKPKEAPALPPAEPEPAPASQPAPAP